MVGGNDALVVQAEAAGQVETAGQAAKVRNRMGGGTGEALVVIGAEASENGVGLFEVDGLSQAKFTDQAILTSAPGALDAALSLRRVGGDLLDAERLESTSELSGSLCSGELLGEGPVRIVALKDGVTIAVKAERNAVRGDQGVQGAKLAESIFGFELEMSGEDLRGSIVLKADEGECGAAALEPVMTAGMGERHPAETRSRRAAGAILAWPALLRRGQFRGSQDAPHGLAADREVFLIA